MLWYSNNLFLRCRRVCFPDRFFLLVFLFFLVFSSFVLLEFYDFFLLIFLFVFLLLLFDFLFFLNFSSSTFVFFVFLPPATSVLIAPWILLKRKWLLLRAGGRGVFTVTSRSGSWLGSISSSVGAFGVNLLTGAAAVPAAATCCWRCLLCQWHTGFDCTGTASAAPAASRSFLKLFDLVDSSNRCGLQNSCSYCPFWSHQRNLWFIIGYFSWYTYNAIILKKRI